MKDNKLKITKTKLARLLRQEQTEAEKELWELLRNRKFENLKFRRQHPLKDYIVDFFCKELNLIIELDGGYHNEPQQKEKDESRD
ncbi:MAG: endonuclease domain-containing protein, partial [Leeuwenhoekiella sp.]